MKITDTHTKHMETMNEDTIFYRGHGRLESSPASNSVLHVISHELDHVAEFKSQAIQDKVEIRSIDMNIHYEIRDGKLVAVGGDTKMITAKKLEEIKTSSDLEVIDSYVSAYENDEEKSKTKNSSSLFSIYSNEERVKERLEQIQQELKTILTKAYYSDPLPKTAEGIKDGIKESRFQEIRNKIQNELEELKQKEQVERSKAMLLKIAEMQENLELGVVVGIFNTSGSSVQLFA
jgi:hypothetical protein